MGASLSTIQMEIPNRTRAEHVAYCKSRALEYVDAGQLTDALASILSDLRKHPDVNVLAIDMVYGMEALTGGLDTAAGVRKFIEGIN
jgi:hypothetical protein